jgi:hypothetical protein
MIDTVLVVWVDKPDVESRRRKTRRHRRASGQVVASSPLCAVVGFRDLV